MLKGCFLMFVQLIVQDDKVRVVQTLLFIEGINTLIQTLFGTRLPTVIGGSYAFMVPIISIIHDSSLAKIDDPHLVSPIFVTFFSPHFCTIISAKAVLTILKRQVLSVNNCVSHPLNPIDFIISNNIKIRVYWLMTLN